MRCTSLSAFILCVAAALAFADHGKGSVSGKTLSPRTLHQGDMSLEIGAHYQASKSMSDADFNAAALDGHDIHSVGSLFEFSLGGSYGITDHLNVSASLPYSMLHEFKAGSDDGMGGVAVDEAGSISGLGDATLTAKYSLLSTPVELSVIGGFKLPTGATGEETDDGAELEPDHQPGTGTVDFLLGVAVAKQLDDLLSVGASLLLKAPVTKGHDDFKPGFSAQAGVKAEYQFAGLGTYPRWYGSLELVAGYAGRDEHDGDFNRDSGGFLLQLGPGLKARVNGHLSFAGAILVPIVQDHHGEQHDEKFEVLVGSIYDF